VTVLTKTLRFDDDVLDVLRVMRIERQGGGYLGYLEGQLDRDLYARTNKALEVLGGKWSRKAKGHTFTADPREALSDMLDSGEAMIIKDGWFPTPRAVVERMLELVPVGSDDTILEPSAGEGHICDVVCANCGLDPAEWFFCIERDRRRARVLAEKRYRVECGDFLSYSPCPRFTRVYMNPPFEAGQDIDHVRHAYGFLRPGGALVAVMSEGPFFRGDKKATAFREWLASVGGKSHPLPADSFKESGTGVNARLAVIRKQGGSDEPS
jgi:hypothetical protein